MNKETAMATTGRRKCASARVRMESGTGIITINGKKFEDYFETEAMRGYIMQPMAILDIIGKFDIDAHVVGGGRAGQAGAVRHGISRALAKIDEVAYKPVLKKNGMLTRDARVKERKKPGQPGARKRFQFSKR